jgi:poly(A) polymerase
MMLLTDTPWLSDPIAQSVCAAIEAGGFDIYFVGGCVRNAIIGAPVSDLDMSTNAHPDKVIALAKSAGFKAVPTGIDHGTITVVAQGQPFEITTFRRDVETDGRRAVVSFSDDITDDARRRDFTMNAMYARPDGQVVDPLGGLDDAKSRRVRFIEDADLRIREDYLRTLRFFRFVAWYGAPEHGFDADALDAVARNREGLSTLSAERVGSEILKLLSAPDPAPAVAAMRQTGVLMQVLLGSDDRWLAPLVHVESMLSLPADPLRRLAIIGGEDVAKRLRLSNAHTRQLALYTAGMSGSESAKALGFLHGSETALGIIALRSALFEQPPEVSAKADAIVGEGCVFPVKSADLRPAFEGKALGEKLKTLRDDWLASGMTKTKADLLG